MQIIVLLCDKVVDLGHNGGKVEGSTNYNVFRVSDNVDNVGWLLISFKIF